MTESTTKASNWKNCFKNRYFYQSASYPRFSESNNSKTSKDEFLNDIEPKEALESDLQSQIAQENQGQSISDVNQFSILEVQSIAVSQNYHDKLFVQKDFSGISSNYGLSESQISEAADNPSILPGEPFFITLEPIITPITSENQQNIASNGLPRRLATILSSNQIALISSADSSILSIIGKFGCFMTSESTQSSLSSSSSLESLESFSEVVFNFSQHSSLCFDEHKNIAVSDTLNHAIRYVDFENQKVVRIAGAFGQKGNVDGDALNQASFSHPTSIITSPLGYFIVCDSGNNRIRLVADGMVYTIAGSGESGALDGPSLSASFNFPLSIQVTSDGEIIVADTNNHSFRYITNQEEVVTMCGLQGQGSEDGPLSTASLTLPSSLSWTYSGNLLFTQTSTNSIRSMNIDQTITTHIRPYFPNPKSRIQIGQSVQEILEKYAKLPSSSRKSQGDSDHSVFDGINSVVADEETGKLFVSDMNGVHFVTWISQKDYEKELEAIKARISAQEALEKEALAKKLQPATVIKAPSHLLSAKKTPGKPWSLKQAFKTPSINHTTSPQQEPPSTQEATEPNISSSTEEFKTPFSDIEIRNDNNQNESASSEQIRQLAEVGQTENLSDSNKVEPSEAIQEQPNPADSINQIETSSFISLDTVDLFPESANTNSALLPVDDQSQTSTTKIAPIEFQVVSDIRSSLPSDSILLTGQKPANKSVASASSSSSNTSLHMNSAASSSSSLSTSSSIQLGAQIAVSPEAAEIIDSSELIHDICLYHYQSRNLPALNRIAFNPSLLEYWTKFDPKSFAKESLNRISISSKQILRNFDPLLRRYKQSVYSVTSSQFLESMISCITSLIQSMSTLLTLLVPFVQTLMRRRSASVPVDMEVIQESQDTSFDYSRDLLVLIETSCVLKTHITELEELLASPQALGTPQQSDSMAAFGFTNAATSNGNIVGILASPNIKKSGSRKSMGASASLSAATGPPSKRSSRPKLPQMSPLDSQTDSRRTLDMVEEAQLKRSGNVMRWAPLRHPCGLYSNSKGTVWATTMDHLVVKFEHGMMLTLAGMSGQPGYVNGNSVCAKFKFLRLCGLVEDFSGGIIIVDSGNHCLRHLSQDGQRVSTYAGEAVLGFRDGPSYNARFNNPSSIVLSPFGDVIISDTGNNRIRVIVDGIVSTLAGTGRRGSDDGAVLSASFRSPSGLSLSPDGDIFIADYHNHKVRKISGGVVSTVAGDGMEGFKDGDALKEARFSNPTSLSLTPDGDIIVSDYYNHCLRLISNGRVTTFAGTPKQQGLKNGKGLESTFTFPSEIAFISIPNNKSGNSVRVQDIVQSYNHTIKLNSESPTKKLEDSPASSIRRASPLKSARETQGLSSDLRSRSVTTISGTSPKIHKRDHSRDGSKDSSTNDQQDTWSLFSSTHSVLVADHASIRIISGFSLPAHTKRGDIGLSLTQMSWEGGYRYQPQPWILEAIEALSTSGIVIRDLWTLSSELSHVRPIVERILAGTSVDWASTPPRVVATILKSFFQKLPSPLLTMELQDIWIGSSQDIFDSQTQRLQVLKQVVRALPLSNRILLSKLISLFNAFCDPLFIPPVWGPILLLRRSLGVFGDSVRASAKVLHTLMKFEKELFSDLKLLKAPAPIWLTRTNWKDRIDDYFTPYINTIGPTYIRLIAVSSKKGFESVHDLLNSISIMKDILMILQKTFSTSAPTQVIEKYHLDRFNSYISSFQDAWVKIQDASAKSYFDKPKPPPKHVSLTQSNPKNQTGSTETETSSDKAEMTKSQESDVKVNPCSQSSDESDDAPQSQKLEDVKSHDAGIGSESNPETNTKIADSETSSRRLSDSPLGPPPTLPSLNKTNLTVSIPPSNSANHASPPSPRAMQKMALGMKALSAAEIEAFKDEQLLRRSLRTTKIKNCFERLILSAFYELILFSFLVDLAYGGSLFAGNRMSSLLSRNETLFAHDEDALKLWKTAFRNSPIVSWNTFKSGYSKAVPSTTIDIFPVLKSVLDHSGSGLITSDQFAHFLHSFGPLEQSPNKLKELISKDWFKGYVSESEAEHLLIGAKEGQFIVRFTQGNPGQFTISRRTTIIQKDESNESVIDNQVHIPTVVHLKVERTKEGSFFAKADQLEETKLYPTLIALINDLITNSDKKNPIEEHTVENVFEEDYCLGELSKEEAESALEMEPGGTFILRANPPSSAYSNQQDGAILEESSNDANNHSTLPGSFFLSLMHSDKKIHHEPIIKNTDGEWMFGGEAFKHFKELLKENAMIFSRPSTFFSTISPILQDDCDDRLSLLSSLLQDEQGEDGYAIDVNHAVVRDVSHLLKKSHSSSQSHDEQTINQIVSKVTSNRNEINPSDIAFLSDYLALLGNDATEKLLRPHARRNTLFGSSKKDSLRTDVVRLESTQVPPNTLVTLSLTLTNGDKPIRWILKNSSEVQSRYFFSCSPREGALSRGESIIIKVHTVLFKPIAVEKLLRIAAFTGEGVFATCLPVFVRVAMSPEYCFPHTSTSTNLLNNILSSQNLSSSSPNLNTQNELQASSSSDLNYHNIQNRPMNFSSSAIISQNILAASQSNPAAQTELFDYDSYWKIPPQLLTDTSLIDSGISASVYRANLCGTVVALKKFVLRPLRIDTDLVDLNSFDMELSSLKYLRHDNIATLIGAWKDVERSQVYLVLKYAEFGSLSHFVGNHSVYSSHASKLQRDSTLLPSTSVAPPDTEDHQATQTTQNQSLSSSSSPGYVKFKLTSQSSSSAIPNNQRKPAVPPPIRRLSSSSLYARLDHPSETQSFAFKLSMALDAARAVHFLHRQGIIHRDVKSLNLLVDLNYKVTLADFGDSRINFSVMTVGRGTLKYRAPELSTRVYNNKVDIFSLGLCMAELMGAQLPTIPGFMESDRSTLPPLPPGLPPKFVSLLKLCCMKNPYKRPTAKQVVQALNEIRRDLLELEGRPRLSPRSRFQHEE